RRHLAMADAVTLAMRLSPTAKPTGELYLGHKVLAWHVRPDELPRTISQLVADKSWSWGDAQRNLQGLLRARRHPVRHHLLAGHSAARRTWSDGRRLLQALLP